MEADKLTIGWMRDINGKHLISKELKIEGVFLTDFITFFNPWKG